MPVVISGTNGVSGVDGTASNPSYEGTDANTGVFFPAADTVAIGTGGTEALRVNSSQNVGIGTNSPASYGSSRLAVVGGEMGISNTSDARLYLYNGTTAAALLFASSARTQLEALQSAPVTFWTGAAERVRVDVNGTVGVGVTPNNWGALGYLKVIQIGTRGAYLVGNTNGWSSAPYVYLGNNAFYDEAAATYKYVTTNAAAQYYQLGGSHVWQRAASGTAGNNFTFTDSMTLSAAGGLSVGTTTDAGAGNIRVNGGALIGDGTAAAPTFTFYNQSDVGMFRAGSGVLGFSTGGTERARINAAGYFKASDNGTYLGSTNTFHEFRQSANDVTLIVHGSSTSQTDNVMYVRASRNTTNNTFYAFGYYNDAAGAYKMRVADSGTVTNSTGTYTTISDIKLKQDVVDASSQWDDIKALRIVNYRLKDYVQDDPDSKPFLGLIAQEVEQVCPGLVEEQEDEVPDEDGKLVKNGEVTKGVKTSILYMKAVKALQEAMTRIEQLEAKVAALEAK